MTDATKNRASFTAYDNNTLLQQKNFMSTKRTISEHINQKKKKKYNKCLYYTLQWIPFSTSPRSTVCTPIVPFHFQICFAEGYALQPGTPKHPVPLVNTLGKSAKFPFVLFIFDHLTCSGFQCMHCRMSCASKDGWVNLRQTQILRNVFLSGNMLVTRSNEISFTL